MIFYRSILLAVLLLCSVYCRAQDENYVYKDTAIFYQDSVEAALEKAKEAPVPDENDTETTEDYLADTTLINNQLSIEPDSVKALKNLGALAYAKHLDSLLHRYQQNQETGDDAAKNEISWIARFFLSPVTKYFFLLLAVVFVCFILYRLFFAEGFFQRSYSRIHPVALPDEDDNPSASADYAKLIAQAVESRNYRMGIRYHFLQSLQKLSSKGAIEFARDKTNHEYVVELSGKKYKNSFVSLTLNYEYVWYGEFEIDEKAFMLLQSKFKQFNNEV